MHVLAQIYDATNQVLRYGFLALHAWALVDCAVRKAAAFPAADKLTKPVWLIILVLAGVFGWFIPPVAGPVAIIALVVSAVYLADVRPAVRDITGSR